MIFKDRTEAGEKLAQALLKDKKIKKTKKDLIVLSLLRGGAAVGWVVAQKLKAPHLPLVVKKVGAPHNEELAIGAVCNQEYVLDDNLIRRLNLSKEQVEGRVGKAKAEQKNYLKRFFAQKVNLKGKTVVLVDDGIATGSSVSAALKYLRKKKVKKIILAVPVAPTDFEGEGFDKVFILHKDPYFGAVSQFYEKFSQLTDEEVVRIFKN